MAIKTGKNLVTSRDQYNAYYGSFRGVDFASDHTEVDNSRFPFAVNVYRDYQSGQGTAVETIPGFRRRLSFDEEKAIYGIYPYDSDLNGEKPTKILIHRGSKLYCLTPKTQTANGAEGTEGDSTSTEGDSIKTEGDFTCKEVKNGDTEFNLGTESSSFKFGRYIYILSQNHYLRIDMEDDTLTDLYSDEFTSAYVPTLYRGGEEAEPGNLLATTAREAIVITDEEETDYPVAWGDIKLDNLVVNDGIVADLSVEYYGTSYAVRENDEGLLDYKYFCLLKNKSGNPVGVSFCDGSPSRWLPENNGYPAGHAGLVVTVPKKSGFVQSDGTVINPIIGCTKNCVYDNRVFFSGNKAYPNMVFWSALNDPTYFGELNFETLGQANEPISAMLPISNVLGVFKRVAEQDGAVFYLTPQLVESDVFAKAYSSEHGLNGVECLGAAVNFADDPIFISPLGVEGIGTLSVRNERAIEHRSSLIDPVLRRCDLTKAKTVVWNGWLFVLCDNGKAFLGDSRQIYTHPLTKTVQYEWYYLEGIGEYVGQIQNGTLDENGNIDQDKYSSEYFYGENYGGTFSPACSIAVVNDNIFFGTENGNLFSFNFDQRKADGEMPASSYSFDGRRYISGVATKMDSAGVPHLNKTTVKKSVVVKFRSMTHAAAKIKVRTNKTPYTDVTRVSSAIFDFGDFNFDDVVFSPTNTPIAVIPEKEKKWVEKQYYIFSDEFEKPFSLVYLAYRYLIAGRYKGE